MKLENRPVVSQVVGAVGSVFFLAIFAGFAVMTKPREREDPKGTIAKEQGRKGEATIS